MKKINIFIIISSISMICMITVIGLIFINRNKTNSFVNINQLSPAYIEKYFDEYEKLGKKDNKSNILIVTTKEQLEETYGAIDIVEAPNNQYFLQYETEEEKEQALKKFNAEDSKIDVSENLVQEISEDTVLVSNYNSWGIEAMGIDTLLDKFNSKELNNVTVAIVDTGLDVDVFNNSFNGRLAGVFNVLENNENMYDNNGHGTHIAGTIAESTPDSVKILPVKVSDSRYMYETDIITAINYITVNKKADVINMSFGGYEFPKGEYIAIDAAKENNIISVAAAGNDNSPELHYPSAMDNVISITAVDSNKEKASFSNYGESIMFATPGVDIKSIASNEENLVMSGTSMATPHAVGAIAILKSLNKDLSLNDIITILRRYSDDLGDISWDEYFGYGFINFSEAEICDGTDCDEYDVFKKSERDNLEEIVDSYEIQPVLTTYNYGTINNILNTKIVIEYTNGKSIEYQLFNIKNLEIGEYNPLSLDKQTINIKFTTSLGVEIDDSFEITNPSTYESVWEYKSVGNNNIEITNYKDTDFVGNTLYFPSQIDGYNVTGIADGTTSIFASAWDSFKKVQNMYLPATLTKIGNNAFTYNDLINGLKYVKSEAESITVGDYAFRGSQSLYNLDATISYVGDYAFYWGTSLTRIKFSNDITYIGEGAFQNAFYEAKLTIPGSITEIGESAFNGSGLKEIEFLNSMENIPTKMMYNNKNLEKVTLPDGLKEIGERAFYGCDKLATINLPESLTTIGKEAFYGAFDEGKIIIPNKVTTIGDYAFYTSGLKEIEFLNSMESVPTKMMYNNKNLEKVTLPDGLKEIGESAFYGCDKLATINLPESLTTIGKEAFRTAFDSSKDVLLEIPMNVTTVGTMAFAKTGLKEVKFMGGIESLPTSMFNASSNLEKVTLPDGLKEIGERAFYGCEKIKTINLPESLTTIGNGAFYGAFKNDYVEKITIPKNVITIGTEAFSTTSLKEVEFLNNISAIPAKMFQYNNKMEKITLPESVTEIGENAFYYNSSLKEINLPENLTTIRTKAFYGAFDVESKIKIVIPNKVSTIGNNAFEKSNIVEVIIGDGVEELPASIFKYNEYLEKVTLPDGLKIIGDSAFDGCGKLATINLPESLTTIGRYALSDIKVKSVTIPQNVTTIGTNIFDSSSVEEVIILANIQEIPSMTFRMASRLEKVVLPESLATIKKADFYDNNPLKEIYFGKNITSIENGSFADKETDFKFYVYNDTVPKTYAEENNIDYVLIDPNEVSIKNIKSQYFAFEKINLEDVSIELTYNEKNTRKEIINENIEIVYPELRNDFRYGDNSVKIITYNSLGYKIEKDISIEVIKAIPNYEVPKNLVAELGQSLYDIQLPNNFEWSSDNITFDTNGNQRFIARYIPEDTVNYEIVENIEIIINVAPKIYTVTFNSNDGKNTTSIQEMEYNKKTMLNQNIFERDGYKFKLWNTKADGTGTPYSNKQEISITENLILYAIWEESYSYIINKYTIDESNKYIDLIDINTTVDNFKKNIELNTGYTVDVDYKSVSGKNLLYTGGKTRIYKNGELYIEYTNIIRGDVNGNAIIDIIDYIRIMKDIMDTTKLTGAYIKAADVNQNDKIDIIDYIRIMKMIMEENS